MTTVFFLFLMLSNMFVPARCFEGNTNTLMPAAAVVEVTDSNFKQEVLDSRTLVLVIFGAPWAGPSRKMMPIVESVAKDYEGRVKVGKLNVDENGKTTEKYNIKTVPTLIVFKNGKEQKRIAGLTTKDQITRTLDKYLRGNR